MTEKGSIINFPKSAKPAPPELPPIAETWARLGRALLLMARGLPPDEVVMGTEEAASLCGVDRETIRNWVRKHGVGAFNAQAGQYEIYRSRLRSFLWAHWNGFLPAGFDDFDRAQIQNEVSWLIMEDDILLEATMRQGPLSEHERAQLGQLLRRAQATAMPAAVQALTAKQSVLAREEARVSAALDLIRAQLDDASAQLDRLRKRADADGFDGAKVRELTESFIAHMRAMVGSERYARGIAQAARHNDEYVYQLVENVAADALRAQANGRRKLPPAAMALIEQRGLIPDVSTLCFLLHGVSFRDGENAPLSFKEHLELNQARNKTRSSESDDYE